MNKANESSTNQFRENSVRKDIYFSYKMGKLEIYIPTVNIQSLRRTKRLNG